MLQAKASAPVRVGLALALTVGVAATARGVLAEGDGADQAAEQATEQPAEPTSGAAVVIRGGTFSTDNNITIGADGVTTTADSSGGSTNSAATGGVTTADGSGGTETMGSIETASAGNGGVTTADGSGGTFYSPTDAEGNPIPAVETGGNQGATINVGDVVGGEGRTSIEIYGGDVSVSSDLTFSVSGGLSTADASGGDLNVATLVGADIDVSGQVAAAGNGGVATSSATGGIAPLGTVLTGRNRGAVINLGDVTGGSGNAGDIDIRIDGGTLDVTTVASLDVATGGTATALAPGGMMNVAEILGDGGPVFAGNGGVADASANGGVTTIGTVDGELFAYPIAGLNRGATITLMGVQGGSGFGGQGGDATVDVYGGDLRASAIGVDGPAYAGQNSGANIDAGMVIAGNGYGGGQGGDATLWLDGGSIDASASGPTGADAGDNRGARIVVGQTVGGDADAGGSGGDALVAIEASDITTAASGLLIEGPAVPASEVDVPWDGPGASAGDGGTAEAQANAGSASTGAVFAGDNVGTDVRVGDVRGGDGIGGNGGDATVMIEGTDIDTSFWANVDVSGGAADATAIGGLRNVAGAPEEGGSAAAGSGGFAGAYANGGLITIGDVFVGGNSGGVISVGNVTGGTGLWGDGGDATFSLAGGSITASVLLNLEAVGGEANASADGGSGNIGLLLGDGTTGLGAAAGTGGVAIAGAGGGRIDIGDVNVGENVGASGRVGDITGGDGLSGGVGGDATLAITGGDIVSLIQLDLQANGGFADASADGGSNNIAIFDARDATRLDGIDVLSGVGGVANAIARGGTIQIGELFAGGNEGVVFKFGNISGGDAAWGGRGDSVVYNRFSGDVIAVARLVAAANGGSAVAGADGGSNNVAVLTADGTTVDGIPRVGTGGTSVSNASGGLITAGDITSGFNSGGNFEQPREDRNRNAADSRTVPGIDAKPGRPSAGAVAEKGVGGGDRGGRGGKNIRALPSTGEGAALGAAGLAGALAAVGAVLAAINGRLHRRRDD